MFDDIFSHFDTNHDRRKNRRIYSQCRIWRAVEKTYKFDQFKTLGLKVTADEWSCGSQRGQISE